MDSEYIYIDGKKIKKDVAKHAPELFESLDKINEIVTLVIQSENKKINLYDILKLSTNAINKVIKQ